MLQQFTTELWLGFAYGTSVALYAATFMYMVLFALYHATLANGVIQISVTNQHNIRIFLLAGFSYLCFGLFNLYALQIHYPHINQLFSSGLLDAFKFSAPLSLLLFTRMFTLAVPIESLQSFVFWRHQKKYYDLLYVIDVIFIFILAVFITEPTEVVMLSLLLFVPHCLAGVIFAYKGLSATKLNVLYASIFAITSLIMAFLALMVYHGQHIDYATTLLPYIHIILGFIVLFLSSIVVQFIKEEQNRFVNVEEVRIVNFFSQIYTALSRDEFQLYYQPKLNLVTGQPSGLEALIRWQHPSDGMMSPDMFIPAAEQTDVINDICQWTIVQVVRDLSVMHLHGINLPISLNFSPKNLYPEMIEFLEQQFNHAQLDPANLVIEITETLFFNQTEEQIKAIGMLKKLGAKISLDDYGTGFSSLGNLDSTGADEIKIDKSFVLNINNNSKNFVIVQSTIDLGRALNIEVVAEGVETHDIQAMLKNMNCHCAQGYGIARPMALMDTMSWITHHGRLDTDTSAAFASMV